MTRRAAPGTGQFALFAEADLHPKPPPKPPAPCIFNSPARGLAARLAEWNAWTAEHGRPYHRSHGWHVYITCPDTLTERCQPTVIECEFNRIGDDPPPCGHDHIKRCRGCCRGCAWEGPDRDDENAAVEDGMDHAWPGWRDLPAAPRPPSVVNVGKASHPKQVTRWTEQVNAVYPAGWLGAGGPIRTLREKYGTRHVPNATPWGGYDLAVITPEDKEQTQ